MALVLSAPAMADSITPGSAVWTVQPGVETTLTIEKTVTVDQRLSGDLDILFLFDASASMGELLTTTSGATVAGNIITQLSNAYGSGSDTLRMGVAYYQDFPDGSFGVPGEVPYGVLQTLTTSTALAQTGLQNLATVMTGGHPSNDAESGLHALYQAATTMNWDPLARKVLVWIGDAPQWDADLVAAYPDPFDVGINDAIAALNAQNIIVEALSVGLALGLDGEQDPYGPAGGLGAGPLQASAIATGTGGSVTDLTGVALGSITGDQLLQSILDAIEIGLTNYEEVSLDVSVAEALGLVVDFYQLDPDMITDASVEIYTGDYDRSETRHFRFQVNITVGPSAEGTVYSFPIYGTLNGNRIVTEWDRIYVGDRPVGPGDVPEPSTIALMGLGLLGVGFAARRKLRK